MVMKKRRADVPQEAGSAAMPPTGRHHKGAIRREQIARAALSLIAEGGLKALTIIGIAERIGMVPSALYRHFPSKRHIVDAVLGFLGERLRDLVIASTADATTPIEAIGSTLHGHLQLVLSEPAVPRLLFSEEVVGGGADRRLAFFGALADYLAGITALVDRGQKDGSIRRDLPAEKIALAALGVFNTAIAAWFLSGGARDPFDQFATSWRIYAAGLAPAPSRPTPSPRKARR